MNRTFYRLPRLRRRALTVWRRNLRVWQRMLGPALVLNFGEPVIYLLGLGLGLGAFIGDIGGMPYLAFLASGIVASSALVTVSYEGMYSVYTRMVPQKTYDALLATPLDVDDILFGEMLWCATKGVFSSAAILVVGALLGVVDGPGALLALPVVFLAGMAFAGPALVMTAIAGNYDFFNYYFVLVVTPMLMLCGVFYPLQSLPAAVQDIAQLLPLTHALELVRPLVTGSLADAILPHLLVLVAYALAGHYLATVLARRRLVV
jgi:lipooligosaccharide transport system permease protein